MLVYLFRPCWVFTAVWPSLQLQGAELLSSCGARASHSAGPSRCGAEAPGCSGFSSCNTGAPEHRLGSRGTWARVLRGTWDLPGPGIKSASPAPAGGLFTTEPPGKPAERVFWQWCLNNWTIHMQKSESRHIFHKNSIKMDHRPKCKMQNYKTHRMT